MLVLAAGCGREPAAPAATEQAPAPSTHVGQRVCAECHQKESALWQGSDHQRAMQSADLALGDFKKASLIYNGITSTFFTDNNRLMARTDGPDGQLHDYPIAYTFGVTPLQQYLVALPWRPLPGAQHCLGHAAESRGAASAGSTCTPAKRWITATCCIGPGPAQNWNFMCADCHSTNLQKRYDAASDDASTRPGPRSTSRARRAMGPGLDTWSGHDGRRPREDRADALKGLVFSMKDTSGGHWALPAGAAIAQRTAPLSSRLEVETCGRCHARAARLWPTYEHGRPLADTHRVALLDDGLYEADGQIRDEVYEYGSFLQSKMYQAGVTCSNCHDPHSSALRLPGNALCGQCHVPARYDQPTHHFHHGWNLRRAVRVVSHAGAALHGRRRPARSLLPHPSTRRVGTTGHAQHLHGMPLETLCRVGRRRRAEVVGPAAAARPSFAAAFHAGRARQPEGASLLSTLVADRAQPALVRATALSLLSGYAGARTNGAIDSAAQDPEPLVRGAAAESLSAIGDVVARARIGGRLLADPVRAVRVDAIASLAGVPRTYFSAAEQQAFDAAVTEYREVQRGNADRAESHVNLGTLEAQLGRLPEAEAALRVAIARQPQFVPAYVNLADILRTVGREPEAERVLRDAIVAVPDAADAYNALGLSLVRQRRLPEALDALVTRGLAGAQRGALRVCAGRGPARHGRDRAKHLDARGARISVTRAISTSFER